MALAIGSILDAIESHALAAGLFERVGTHEPTNPPGSGLSCAVWVQDVQPVQSSGLASTSVRVVFSVRLYSSLLQEPADAIDPDLTAALDVLMAAYVGDFTLGGTVRVVDLRGADGTALRAQAGYLEQDGMVFRVFTITLPVIVNDLWTEAP